MINWSTVLNICSITPIKLQENRQVNEVVSPGKLPFSRAPMKVCDPVVVV